MFEFTYVLDLSLFYASSPIVYSKVKILVNKNPQSTETTPDLRITQ